MARGDLLINLVKSGSRGDLTEFRRSAQDLIAEERAKNHTILAERLAESLRIAETPVRQSRSRNHAAGEFIFEQTPRLELDKLILANETQNLCRELIEEQHRSELLRSYGMEPRNRILLSGDPGNGKTSLAEALAYEMAYPLVVIRYETLIGSYLGETAGRLQKVFEYATTQRCVLFFDEFDTLGKERGDAKETGEIKRVVSSLLLQIDRLPSYVVTVAASNHPELLDRAVWRRFQVRLRLPVPTQTQVEGFIRTFFEARQVDLGYKPATIAGHLQGHSFAEIEEFCLDVLRRMILTKTGKNIRKLVKTKLDQWAARREVRG